MKDVTDYVIGNARYSKGNKLITGANGTYKSRAQRLIEALRGRWTNRERGYVLSPTKAARFELLYAEGWDGSLDGKTLTPPRPTSWVLRNKATGEVIAETFDRKKVDALNATKYEAIPIAEYLASLNRPVES